MKTRINVRLTVIAVVEIERHGDDVNARTFGEVKIDGFIGGDSKPENAIADIAAHTALQNAADLMHEKARENADYRGGLN